MRNRNYILMDLRFSIAVGLLVGGIAAFFLWVQPHMQMTRNAVAQKQQAQASLQKEQEEVEKFHRLQKDVETHSQDLARVARIIPAAVVQASVLAPQAGTVVSIALAQDKEGAITLQAPDGSQTSVAVPANWTISVKAGSSVEANQSIAEGPLRSGRPELITLFHELQNASGIGLDTISISEVRSNRQTARKLLEQSAAGAGTAVLASPVATQQLSVSVVATQNGLRSFLRFAAQSLRLLEPKSFSFSAGDDLNAAQKISITFDSFTIPSAR